MAVGHHRELESDIRPHSSAGRPVRARRTDRTRLLAAAAVGLMLERATPNPVLQLEGLRKNFGSLTVTDDVTLDVMPGEMHAIIGPNGAGKTTLINQISGIIPPDGGRIVFAGNDVTALPPEARALSGLARSFQITSILPGFSVLDNVALAVQARDGSSFRFFGRAAGETALNAGRDGGARTGRHRRARARPRRRIVAWREARA